MKYNKPKTRLLYIYSLIAAAIAVVLVEFATPYVINAYLFHWVILLAALILCFSPLGNIKLVAQKNEAPRYRALPWLMRIFALELSLLFVYIGMTHLYSHWLPLPYKHLPFNISASLHIFLKHDGLLPWGLFALYAIGLGYISYVKNQDAYANEQLNPLISTKPSSLLGMIINMQARSATFIVLTTTFAFITLLIARMLTPANMPLITGFYAKTMIIVLALVILGFSPFFKKLTKRLLDRRMPLYIGIISTLFLFAIFIWLINALFGHFGESPVEIPSVIKWFQRKESFDLWIIFAAAWWIGWTPLISAHIARISRGHRIRNVILATLLLPFLFTISMILYPQTTLFFSYHPVFFSSLALVSFVYLMRTLTLKIVRPMMLQSYLPKQDEYKRRDHYFYFRKLFQSMLIVIYLYLPAGIAIAVFSTFAMVLSFSIQVPLYVINVLMRFKTKQT